MPARLKCGQGLDWRFKGTIGYNAQLHEPMLINCSHNFITLLISVRVQHSVTNLGVGSREGQHIDINTQRLFNSSLVLNRSRKCLWSNTEQRVEPRVRG